MRRGFTFFELAVVILLLVLAGMIAIPGVLIEEVVEKEVQAIDALKWIAAAEARARHVSGRYRFLDWLLENTPTDGPWGPAPVPAPATGDIVRLDGYYLSLSLPNADGRPAPPSRSAEVSERLAEHAFRATAWPVEAGRTGRRAYSLGPDLIIHENPNRDERFSGRDDPPLPRRYLATWDETTKRVRLTPPPGHPWMELIPRLQIDDLAARLQASRIPLPPDIREREQKAHRKDEN